MNMSHKYYRVAADWSYDRYQSQSVWLSRSLAALLTVTLLLCLSLASNLFLFPLKQNIPYLYTFNNSTGEVTKLGALEPTSLTANWQLTRYFLMHYVMNRESYDINHIDIPYQLAWSQSDNIIRKQYQNQVHSDTPTSPYRLYGKDKYLTIKVIAINQLNDNTADIRFEKILHDRVSGSQQVAHLEAIIKWQYQNITTTQKMLDRNPLGFIVTYYQVSPVNL